MASATMGPRRRVQQSSTSSASSSSGSSSASSSSSGGSKRTRCDNNNSPSQGNLNGEPAPKKTRSSSQRLAKAKEAQEMAKKVVPPLWNDPRPYASIAGLSIEAQQALCAEGALPSPMSYMSATMSATMASFVGSAAAQLGGGSGSGSNGSGPSSSSSSNAAAAAAAAAMSYLDISNMTARPPGWLPGGPGGNDESTASVGGALGGLSQAFIPPFASVSATATTAAAVPATLPSKTCTSTSTSTSTITSNSSTKTSSPSPVNTPTISSSSTSVSTNNLVSNASSTSTVSLATSSSINTSISVSVSASTNTSTKSAGSPPPPPVLGVLPPTSEVTPAGSPSPGDQMVVVRSDFPNDPMFGAYQPWVIKTYGDLAKTKTITIKKYARILRTLRGEEVNSAENSKFRFWVKSKGFHIGQPEGYDAKPADRIVGRHAVTNPGLDPPLYVPYQLPHNKALNGAEGTVPPGRVYKKVAIVENFFDIIHAVHVDLEGRPGKHAGQKRTYRTITETYAFLPREAVTRFLLGCTECQRRPRTPSPTSLSVASPTPACSTPTPTSASTTSAVGSPSPATTSAASTLIGSEASASATATLTTAISTPTVASTIATTLAATTGAVTATTTNSQEQTKEKPASPKPATTLSSSELEPLLAQVGTATKEASHPSDQSHKGLPSPSPRSPTSPTVVAVEQQQPKSTATVSTGTSTPVVFSGPTFPNNDLKLFNDAIACVTSGNSNVTAFVGINSSINNIINGTGTTPTMSTTTMSSGLPASKPKDDRYNPLSITNLLRKDPVPARRPNPVPLINGVLPSAQVPLVSLESSDAAAPLMTPAAPPNFEPSCTAPARGLRVVPEDQLLRAARSTPSPSLGASSVIWNPEIPSKSSPLGIPVGATTPVDYSRSLCAAFSRQPQLHPLTQSLQSLQPASIIEAIKRESEALQAAAGRRTLPSSIAKSLPLPLTTAADAALRMTATTKTTNGVSHSSESEGEDPENEAFSPAAGLIDTNLNLLATIQQLHCQVMLALTERLRPAVTTSPSGIVGSSPVHHRHSNGPPAADES